MIKSITVTNYLGDSIKLKLQEPEESGFVITSITGLGPGKANINTSDRSTDDGSLYNSSRLPNRNIVINIRYLWKDTIEEARQLSYKYFPIKRKVTLLIEADNRIGQIEGYVESNEPNIFSKEEDTDISIICPYPFYYAAYQENSTSFSGIEPVFEFPFSNESLTVPLLEFSIIRDVVDRVINYTGDHEIGITITINAIAESGDITIYNVDTSETMKIYTKSLEALTGSGIISGDEIVICTVKGKKSATLIRNAKTTNILNCIDKNSDWFQLVKGNNTFAYTSETGQNNLRVEISNSILYEGI